MPINISEVFTASSIALHYNEHNRTVNTVPYLGETFFPSAKKQGVDLKFIKGKSGAPKMLKPHAYDTKTTIRNRNGITTFQNEMPFFKDSLIIDETDRRELLRCSEVSDPYAKIVLSHMYKDTQDLVDGANVVPEIMRMQLISPADGKPKISITANGIPLEYSYDPNGEFASTNFKMLKGTSQWSDIENSDPESDIEDAIEKLVQLGYKPSVMIISPKTMIYLKNNKNINSRMISRLSAVGGAVRVTKKDVISYFKDEFELSLVVYEKRYLDADDKSVPFFPDGIATLLPSTAIGSTFYGVTPEEADLISKSKTDAECAIVNNGIAITTITQSDPVTTQVKVSEVVLPSFEGMDGMYVINIEGGNQ